METKGPISGYESEQIDTDWRDQLGFVDNWFLMGSPVPVTLIIAAYLLFVLKIGPDFMKNRKPYTLQTTLLVYNIAQVIMSTFMMLKAYKIISDNGLLPSTCVMETDSRRKIITSGFHTYLLLKITELLDTVFFVLRKKDNQVTFLHVYHHSLLVAASWSFLKFEPNFYPVFLGTINSFVHVIMYAYYGLSAFPNLSKYLWWKKYITSMQMIQFVLILLHFTIMCRTSQCSPSFALTCTMVFNLILFLYLFGKFYLNTYTKRDKSKSAERNTNKKIEDEKLSDYNNVDTSKYYITGTTPIANRKRIIKGGH